MYIFLFLSSLINIIVDFKTCSKEQFLYIIHGHTLIIRYLFPSYHITRILIYMLDWLRIYALLLSLFEQPPKTGKIWRAIRGFWRFILVRIGDKGSSIHAKFFYSVKIMGFESSVPSFRSQVTDNLIAIKSIMGEKKNL